ncbi:hypothetical protein LC653_11045 [Nostoc sp. CHAB 5784]|uniref:hypothetical protein n=1 Tax=Nostoc mirabile TaxID=2907820 RepID=UPI001E65966C|nr:hypothetical protein [Nostoc mirabile]MCC5664436.1 hypothetical protein [Nostoc mirabile CHAB5784]
MTICEICGIGSKYNLFLPQDDETIVILNQEVPVKYTILQGKYAVGIVFIGALISLSQKGAQLRKRPASCQQKSPHFLELLSNIKLKLLNELKLATEEEHIYAKVIQQSNLDEHLFLLRFTAVPLKAMSDGKPLGVYAILNALCQPG